GVASRAAAVQTSSGGTATGTVGGSAHTVGTVAPVGNFALGAVPGAVVTAAALRTRTDAIAPLPGTVTAAPLVVAAAPIAPAANVPAPAVSRRADGWVALTATPDAAPAPPAREELPAAPVAPQPEAIAAPRSAAASSDFTAIAERVW